MKLKTLLLCLFVPFIGYTQTYNKTVHFNIDNGLSQSTVWRAVEDGKGRMWFSSPSGVYYYNGFELTKFPELNGNFTTLEYRKGFIYFAGLEHVYKVDENDFNVSSHTFDKKYYRNLKFLPNKIKVSTNKKYHFIDYDLNVLSPKKDILDTNYYYIRHEPKFGSYKIYGGFDGLFYVSKNADTQLISKAMSGNFQLYDKNRAFVACMNGLFELTLTNGVLTTKHLFKDSRVIWTKVDRNKNLWVCTSEEGVFMLHKNTLNNTFFPKKNIKNNDAQCWGFIKIKNKLYIGTDNGFKSVLPQKMDNFERLTNNIYCISGFSKNSISLFGTMRQGIYRYKNNTLEQIYTNKKIVYDNTVMQIIGNEKGFLAVTKTNFIQFDRNGEFMYKKRTTPPGYTMFIKKAKRGYKAASIDNLFIYDDSLNMVKSYNKPKWKIFSGHIDFKDTTYVVSMDKGFGILLNDSLKQYPFPKKQFLTITNNKEKELWISAVEGLYSYKNQQVWEFNKENGIPIKEFNQNGFYNDGDIYFSGTGGVLRINPEAMLTMPVNPSFNILYNAKPIVDKTIHIAAQKSIIELDIEPINTSNKNYFKLEYFYNNHWIEIKKPTRILLETDYGTSKFKTRSTNLVNQEKIVETLQINRALPYWKKLWFKILMGVLAIFLVIGFFSFYKYLLTRKLLKIEQGEKQIAEERLRISHELHDNIGARLTYIISSLDMEMYQKKEPNTTLEKLNTFARETMGQLRETIWAVSNKEISFSEFMLRVKQYVEQTQEFTPSNISFKDTTNFDFSLNPVQTINFYRIVQEAINNAIKYAEATKISINASNKNKIIKIVIEDNGIGFDQKNTPAGTGIKNIKNRAHEAHGEIKISSKMSKGTKITLTLKPEQNNQNG